MAWQNTAWHAVCGWFGCGVCSGLGGVGVVGLPSVGVLGPTTDLQVQIRSGDYGDG